MNTFRAPAVRACLMRTFSMNKRNSAEWIKTYELFETFRVLAEKQGANKEILSRLENELFDICPIPQPKKMIV